MIVMSLGVRFIVTPWTPRPFPGRRRKESSPTTKTANSRLCNYNNGAKELWITVPSRAGIWAGPNFIAPADESTLALLAEKRIVYKTFVQGRDFGYTWPRRWVSLLCIFILAAGAVRLLWWVSPKFFAVCLVLPMIATGILLGWVTPWHTQSLSAVSAQKMITEHRDARFEILKYSNGSKEIWITPPRSRHYPGFVAPADESTLTLLAENKITFQTSIQGRDFGYGAPWRGMALLYISALGAGAALVLWWAWKKKRRVPAPAESSV